MAQHGPGSAGISGLRTRYSKPLNVVMAVLVLVLLLCGFTRIVKA
jgi:hypothetical protein